MEKKAVENFGYFWFNKSWDDFQKMCKNITEGDEMLEKHIWEKLESKLLSYARIKAGFSWFFDLDDKLREKVVAYINKCYEK